MDKSNHKMYLYEFVGVLVIPISGNVGSVIYTILLWVV